MMGDHRSASQDSRQFGPIDRSTVIGRAWMRYWPLEDFGLIKPVEPESSALPPSPRPLPRNDGPAPARGPDPGRPDGSARRSRPSPSWRARWSPRPPATGGRSILRSVAGGRRRRARGLACPRLPGRVAARCLGGRWPRPICSGSPSPRAGSRAPDRRSACTAEAALGGAAFVIGLAIRPVDPLAGPVAAQAAGVAVVALAVMPLAGRNVFRLGVGTMLLTIGCSLLLGAWSGATPPLQHLALWRPS